MFGVFDLLWNAEILREAEPDLRIQFIRPSREMVFPYICIWQRPNNPRLKCFRQSCWKWRSCGAHADIGAEICSIDRERAVNAPIDRRPPGSARLEIQQVFSSATGGPFVRHYMISGAIVASGKFSSARPRPNNQSSVLAKLYKQEIAASSRRKTNEKSKSFTSGTHSSLSNGHRSFAVFVQSASFTIVHRSLDASRKINYLTGIHKIFLNLLN